MILHIDMDAFYAAIELRDEPSLAGKPVVVGGSPKGRGVIAAASYEARKYGVYSAMPAAKALRQCPTLVFIHPRMDHYAAVSKQIRKIFFEFTSLVEPLALDEAFLDVSGSTGLFGDAPSIARQIKDRIKSELRLVASAGVAPNKYLAKVASDLEKPDGLVVVEQAGIDQFLSPLPISRIWGVGKQTEKKFTRMGVSTIGQLKKIPLELLNETFGINGQHFWKLARGEDTRAVVPDRVAKTVSHETTFPVDIHDQDWLASWAGELTDQVGRRLRRHSIYGKTVQLKLRFSNFETVTRAKTLARQTQSTQAIRDAIRDLLANVDLGNRGVRLIGVGVRNLSRDKPVQQMLFDQEADQKSNRLDKMTDEIKDRFGHLAVRRGASMEYKIRHRPDPRVKDE